MSGFSSQMKTSLDAAPDAEPPQAPYWVNPAPQLDSKYTDDNILGTNVNIILTIISVEGAGASGWTDGRAGCDRRRPVIRGPVGSAADSQERVQPICQQVQRVPIHRRSSSGCVSQFGLPGCPGGGPELCWDRSHHDTPN